MSNFGENIVAGKSEFTIRPATAADVATIADFNCRLAWESEQHALNRDIVLAGVQRGLAHPELCRYWLCSHAGQVVGQLMLTTELSDWRDGLIWWIQSVYTDPDFRRRGVFRQLFEHVIREAQHVGDVRAVRLYVERNNTPALATYQSLGMRDAGYLVYELPL